MEGENYRNFDIVVSKMRKFFKEVKGFREVRPQNKKSILAACEDPKTSPLIIMKDRFGLFHRQDRCGWNTLLKHPDENGSFAYLHHTVMNLILFPDAMIESSPCLNLN